jgi:replicative DNA helicase
VTDEIAGRIVDPTRIKGYPTGFEDLDIMVGGIRLGAFIVLTAGTGTGKTLLALNILMNLSQQGIKSTVFDLENGIDVTLQRLIRMKYQLNGDFFLNEADKKMIRELSDGINNIQYYDAETMRGISGETELDKVSKVIKARAEDGDKVFLVDPLNGLIKAGSSSESTAQEGQCARQMKRLVEEYGVSIILCHHLKKGGRAGEYVENLDEVKEAKYVVPTLEAVRGSSQVVEWATDVWGLIRTHASVEKELRGKAVLKVLKQRTGLTGDVKLDFDEDTLSFRSSEKSILEKVFGSDAREVS